MAMVASLQHVWGLAMPASGCSQLPPHMSLSSDSSVELQSSCCLNAGAVRRAHASRTRARLDHLMISGRSEWATPAQSQGPQPPGHAPLCCTLRRAALKRSQPAPHRAVGQAATYAVLAAAGCTRGAWSSHLELFGSCHIHGGQRAIAPGCVHGTRCCCLGTGHKLMALHRGCSRKTLLLMCRGHCQLGPLTSLA